MATHVQCQGFFDTNGILNMPNTPYPVLEVLPQWVLDKEAMGSKEKFWYRCDPNKPPWLFKFPQPNTGQHWAEKIAAELAADLEITHAVVELALFDNTRGSASESFAVGGWDLFHGNQMLAGKVTGYDPGTRFRQADHTLANILLALDRTFTHPDGRQKNKVRFAEYLVFDALIGNTDRHHENWGILRRQTVDRWTGMLAPTFDHASSLGRELLDEGPGKSRKRLLSEKRIPYYAEKAAGAIYWESTDRRGLSPLELVRRAAPMYPDLFKPAFRKREKLDAGMLSTLLDRVPADWMSGLAREFVIAFVCYTIEELRKIRL
jgi:HipA-like C-terminal domain